MTIGLLKLQELKETGHYIDYKLSEYEAIKIFIEHIELLDHICVVGGNANLDIFYATQNINPPPHIYNFDDNGECDRFGYMHNQYKEMFSFKGKYQHYKIAVLNLDKIFTMMKIDAEVNLPLCLMLNAHQDGLYELIDRGQYPDYTIVSHYGKYKFVEPILSYAKHNRLIMMSDNLVFFSNKKLKRDFDFNQGSLNTIKRNWFEHQNIDWII